MVDTIGLIAGGGQFPFLVARGARQAGHRVVAVGFPSNTDEGLASELDAYRELKLGQLGKLIDWFREQGVTRVVMAGTINKARALDIRPDFRAAKLLFKLRGKGDDALLRTIAEELESEGFRVARAHEVVPELLTPAGVLTKTQPSPEQLDDLRYGWPVAKQIGALDIGQTLVVRKQMVAAVEALEGTDRAILRGGELAGEGCVVIKVFKPGQEDRIDLPSLGLQTVETLKKAKAGCLVVEAGRSLFFDRERSLEEADRAGICIVGVTEDYLKSIS